MLKLPTFFLSFLVVFAGFLTLSGSSLAADALPQGYEAVSGASSYQASGSMGTLTATDKATIGEWAGGFNIGSANTFNALLPEGGAHLSRDITSNPSQIFGALNVPRGKFFLVNTNGTYFAPGSSVNAAGLVASSLQMRNDDFLAGRYRFSQEGAAASVRNAGTLLGGKGGIALLGGSVENSGRILAKEGNIVLASGKAMTLSFDPQGLLSVLANSKLSDAPQTSADAVRNNGFVRAEGGIVSVDSSRSQIVVRSKDGKDNTVFVRQGQISNYATGDRVQMYLLPSREQIQAIQVIRVIR